MPIDWTKSKYSKKHRLFLSKKPEDMAFFTLCDGAVRSAKTLSIIYKIPQMFDFVGNEYLKVFSGYSKNTVRNNVLVELLPYLKNYHGAQVKFNSASGELDIKLWGKLYNCLVVGGGKSDSDSNMLTSYPNIIMDFTTWLYPVLLRRMHGQLQTATPKVRTIGFTERESSLFLKMMKT